MRRFHQATGVVLGYDETAFPPAEVQRVWQAWKALFPARTLRFLRQDAAAPASVLLSLGSFHELAGLLEVLDRIGSDLGRAARETLRDLFAASLKPHAEFQFRYDLKAVMVRGRFVPAQPGEVDAALRGLRDLATTLARASPPPDATVVVAAYRGGWTPDRAHGFDPARGAVRPYRYREGRWEPEGGGRT